MSTWTCTGLFSITEHCPHPAAMDLGSIGFVSTQEEGMAVYKVIELVGTSPTSWEEAAASAVAAASQSLQDLRVAEIADLDLQLGEQGQVVAYRAKVKVSFKYHTT